MYEEADEETEDNLYVHHDVIVPYFPLSVAWLDLDPTGEQLHAMFAACFFMPDHVRPTSLGAAACSWGYSASLRCRSLLANNPHCSWHPDAHADPLLQ